MISYRQVQPGDVIFVIFKQKISSLVTKLQNILVVDFRDGKRRTFCLYPS